MCIIDTFIYLFISIVITSQESFKTAKLAYRQFKLRVRKTLSSSHFGPESLEDAAVDYIVRNLDLYDIQASINVGRTSSAVFMKVAVVLHIVLEKVSMSDVCV